MVEYRNQLQVGRSAKTYVCNPKVNDTDWSRLFCIVGDFSKVSACQWKNPGKTPSKKYIQKNSLAKWRKPFTPKSKTKLELGILGALRTFLYLCPTARLLHVCQKICKPRNILFVPGDFVFQEYKVAPTERISELGEKYCYSIVDFLLLYDAQELIFHYSKFGVVTPSFFIIFINHYLTFLLANIKEKTGKNMQFVGISEQALTPLKEGNRNTNWEILFGTKNQMISLLSNIIRSLENGEKLVGIAKTLHEERKSEISENRTNKKVDTAIFELASFICSPFSGNYSSSVLFKVDGMKRIDNTLVSKVHARKKRPDIKLIYSDDPVKLALQELESEQNLVKNLTATFAKIRQEGKSKEIYIPI